MFSSSRSPAISVGVGLARRRVNYLRRLPSLSSACSSSRYSSTSSSPSPPWLYDLPTTAPEATAENTSFASRVAAMESFLASPRFTSLGTVRPYTARDLVLKQGSHPPLPMLSGVMASKLWRLLEKANAEGRPVHTMGAIDPVQMTQMAKWLEVVYVSGWACSSVLTTGNNEVGPDLGCVFSRWCCTD
jgi:hypothetical protein